MRLVIDPGHGGNDPGCAHNGVTEKELVLELGQRLRAGCPKGVRVTMTRADDTHPSLAERGFASAKASADVVVSLHANAANDAHANYFAVFVLPRDDLAQSVGKAVLSAAPKELKPKVAPIEVNSTDWTSRAFHVLHPHQGRHPVLVECGFLSNPAAALFLASEHGKGAVVSALLAGVKLAEERCRNALGIHS